MITDEMIERAMAAFDHYQWDITPLDAMRAALVAALAATEPPSPGDADEAFDAALEAMTIAVLKHEEAGQWRDWESFEHLGGEVFAARRHILDMHRQARRAGLRELRELRATLMSDECKLWSDPDGTQSLVLVADIAAKIDAMLQGAEGEGEQ